MAFRIKGPKRRMPEQKGDGTKLECLLNPGVFAAEEGLG